MDNSLEFFLYEYQLALSEIDTDNLDSFVDTTIYAIIYETLKNFTAHLEEFESNAHELRNGKINPLENEMRTIN